MNSHVAEKYLEKMHQLALGIEFIDPVRGRGLMHPVRVDIERAIPHEMKRPADPYCAAQSNGRVPCSLCRHPSGRYALLYSPGIGNQLIVRIYDHCRFYVPRRLQVPLLTLEQLEIPAQRDPSLRRRLLALFPGAAYDHCGMATGLRGRVLRNGQPMRWAWIEARLPENDALVGRARGDDRGEFLLLLAPGAAPASDLTRTIQVRISVAGPSVAPVPSQVDIPGQDVFWDLPLEVLPAPGLADDVALGDALPAGYVTMSAVQTVEMEIGRMLTGIEVPPFEFVLP
jgi:hypothetical protein